MTRTSNLETISSVATLLGGMLIVAALYVARDVFVPLTLAVLLSFLLSPVVNRIQRLGVSNVFAVLGTALAVFVLLAGTLTFVGRELTTLISDIPHYKSELVSKARGLAGLRSGMGDRFDELTKEVTEAIDEKTMKPNETTEELEKDVKQADSADLLSLKQMADRLLPNEQASQGPLHDGKSPATPIFISNVSSESPVRSWAGTVGNILGPLGTAGLVTVFVLFLLIYRDDMRDRIIKVISRGDYVTTTDALDEASRRISKYLVAQTIVNTCYGVTFGMGLFFIGRSFAPDGQFPNFVLWGALATLLRFVPYIGPVIATAFPILLSLAVFPGYSVTIAVVTLIVVIELGCNNILEPWLYGSSTGLSSVAIILAAVFWGWLWGPVGLLLSTPLTVCLVVLGNYVPRFRFFSTLLGEKVDIAPSLLFYQRLLANKQERAAELLESCIKECNAMTVIDTVLVPTLRQVRKDVEEERLSSEQANLVSQEFAKAIANVKWSPKEEIPKKTSDTNDDVLRPQRPSVLTIPAHHPNEELLLGVFSQANPTLDIEVGSSNAIPDQFAAYAMREHPPAIVIHVLPPGGVIQAKFLCNSIRKAGYVGTIIVCCSGKFRNFDRLFVKFRKAGANSMTTSFKQTAQKLSFLKTMAHEPEFDLVPRVSTIEV